MGPFAIAGTIVGSVIAFVALWLSVSAILSWIGGWSALATRFRTAPENATSRIRLPTAYMRAGVSSSSVIGLNCLAAGLSLSALLPFRFCHPPLLIPWTEIEAKQFKVLWVFREMKLVEMSKCH